MPKLTRVPNFVSCDSYGNFTVEIGGKRYDFHRTDAASHSRWKWELGSPNPKVRWEAMRQIKMSSQPAEERVPQKKSEKQLTFRNWIKESLETECGFRLLYEVGEPKCPKCGSAMVLRTNRAKGNQFYGCSKYPNCNGTLGYKPQGQQASPQPTNQPRNQQPANQPQQPTQPATQPATQQWVKAKVIGNFPGLNQGDIIAVRRQQDGSWAFNNPRTDQMGALPGQGIEKIIQAIRDEQGQTIKGEDPLDFLDQTPQIINRQQQTDIKGRNGKPLVIPRELMSSYNIAIEQSFAQSGDNIMIDALAGTGKTTMLKHLASFKQPNERWLYLVFNEKNQKEANPAFPEGIDVRTTHSYLGDVLKQNGKEVGGKTNLPQEGDPPRIRRILDNLLDTSFPPTRNMFPDRRTGDMVNPHHWKAKYLTEKIASLGKAFALNPDSPTLMKELNDLVVSYNLDMDLSTDRIPDDVDLHTRTQQILEKVVQVLQITKPNSLPKNLGSDLVDLRDHDDTLWYGALYADDLNWNKRRYSVVLLDEAQDFNQCNLIMAQKLKESGARIIAVGDPNQSLYRFRGADAHAFEHLKQIVADGRQELVKPLPINFRSDPKVIDFITRHTHVKNLQANPKLDKNAGEGTDHFKYEDYMANMMQGYGKDRKFQQSNAIIARLNAPLASTAMTLLKNNIDFEILGRDLSKELVKYIKRVCKDGKAQPERVGLDDLEQMFPDFSQRMTQKWGNKLSKADELKEIQDSSDALVSVISHLRRDDGTFADEAGTPMSHGADLIRFVERRLAGKDPDKARDMEALAKKDPKSYMTLTTAHKSKGLEWDKVFVLRKDDFDPSGPRIRTPEDAQQERNAWFVALSRARNSINLSADDQP